MIKITLKDGNVLEFEAGVSVLDVAISISEGLARNTTSALVNNELVDVRHILNEDASLELLTLSNKEGMHAYWHTAAHMLAQAVKRLYPTAKFAIGPAIDNGFYYDFDVEENLDLDKIQAEMKKIAKENIKIERYTLSRDEALAWAKESGEIYKEELISELPEDAEISFYRQGDFTDLCAGPHLQSTKTVKYTKLLNLAGAYWRGSEKNKMLKRVYGVSFDKASILEDHLEKLEDAKKRDHNKLGKELKLFTTSPEIGQGLPLLMPKGAKIVQLLQRFVEDEEEKRGYVLTKTPLMAKSDLYKKSGHWDHYQEGMFKLSDDDEQIYALRPMTCPFQFTIYNADGKSYRDLPIRYGETSTLFRNESSGEMHGLIRVRQFTISEGHLVVTPEQLEDEFKGVVDLIDYMMDTLGIAEDVTYQFSKWDPNNKDKYIGDAKTWESTQDEMRNILNHLNIDFVEAEGEAAFYGPKLDIQFKNVHGKEDTIITVQIDFALAEKFDMSYVDKDGEKKRPFIIHRTSIGCYERTLAMLIEKYAGAFPTWLAPVQVKILPLSDKYDDYVYELKNELQKAGIRVELDLRGEKIGYKIREAQLEKVPYMLVIGENEATNKEIAIRSRKDGDLGSKKIEEFIKEIKTEINEKRR